MILFPGKKVRIGQSDYIVPALTIRQVRVHADTLAKFATFKQAAPSDKDIDAVIEVIHAALSRNYPKLELEELQDIIDMNNLPLIVMAIAGQSGIDEQGETAGSA